MDQSSRRARPVLEPASRPILPRHVRLQFDKARERWVILAPERVLVPDEISVEVLQLCDGERSIDAVVAVLVAKYVADPQLILTDCLALLQDLADKGYLLTVSETP
ncbi:MAG: pyrroloquinoline quinone biosynthesis peptide chaperone PqqD [Candidatus Saccharibacteria bacterium]|nr:pyrroloquinoline quinone biosynthesis peptide chaperone PqqD [Pseudorhodobacter sp.]